MAAMFVIREQRRRSSASRAELAQSTHVLCSGKDVLFCTAPHCQTQPCAFPAGIPIDGKTVFTSDHALKLDWIPQWIAIIGSGYIGLEFSDVYTALGSDVTFIEACLRPSSIKSSFAAQCGLGKHPPGANEPCTATSLRGR